MSGTTAPSPGNRTAVDGRTTTTSAGADAELVAIAAPEGTHRAVAHRDATGARRRLGVLECTEATRGRGPSTRRSGAGTASGCSSTSTWADRRAQATAERLLGSSAVRARVGLRPHPAGRSLRRVEKSKVTAPACTPRAWRRPDRPVGLDSRPRRRPPFTPAPLNRCATCPALRDELDMADHLPVHHEGRRVQRFARLPGDQVVHRRRPFGWWRWKFHSMNSWRSCSVTSRDPRDRGRRIRRHAVEHAQPVLHDLHRA